jgi:hypothetical protein
MATEPPRTATPAAEPPQPPGAGASRDEWRAWSHQQRDYMREHVGGGWYGPWPWGGGGVWPWFWGAALVLIGGYYLLQNLGLLNWVRGDVLWPSLLIMLGVLLLIRRGRDRWP